MGAEKVAKKRRAAEAEPEAEAEEVEAEEVAEVAVPKKRKKQAQEESAEPPVAEVGKLSPEQYRVDNQIVAVRREGQQEDTVLPDPIQSFSEAPFSKKIKEALGAAGFAAPSSIQAQAWPCATDGFDLVAVAKTGSGKTLAFLLPAFKLIAQHVKENGEANNKGSCKPLALVLAPTRELATQIQAECAKFAPCAKVRSVVLFGGAPKQDQAKAMKNENPHIAVATPGRLQDFMNGKEICLKAVQFLVLDEADRMLDMGFEPEIAKILADSPSEKQTLLFTATWPKTVRKIAAAYLKKDYIHINVGNTEELSANKAVSQEFFKHTDDEKENRLHRILDGLPETAKMIVFTNTKRRVEALSKAFRGKGYSNVALHGDKPQWERDRDLATFKQEGGEWLLFATDVCARGLDIKAVSHVVNYDMARDVEGYVHRIGRTGRAGNTGVSITFWNEDYDMECAPALAKIAKEAGQEVPEWLDKAAAKSKTVKNKAWRY